MGQPPGALLVDFAQALQVIADELLGVEPLKDKVTPKLARLRKRLQRVEDLPAADQRARRFKASGLNQEALDNLRGSRPIHR